VAYLQTRSRAIYLFAYLFIYISFILVVSYFFESTLSTQLLVTMVNSTNVLDEGLRIGEIGRQMNSKVRLVEIGVYRK
jgi:hypothetical protein